MFDGENVYWGNYNPYKEVVMVEGNDGSAMAPGTPSDEKNTIYITNLF